MSKWAHKNMADNAEGRTNSRPEIPAGKGAAPSSAAERWRPKVNPWVIAVVVAMAAFMEVLDTSIANVALPYMAGNLGVRNDESTWVSDFVSRVERHCFADQR